MGVLAGSKGGSTCSQRRKIGWTWSSRHTRSTHLEFCSALEFAPEADDIDPVDEAEHDEVDEALLADDVPGEDRMLACLAWARVEAQTSSKSVSNQKSS